MKRLRPSGHVLGDCIPAQLDEGQEILIGRVPHFLSFHGNAL
jgi:hypothetical protein